MTTIRQNDLIESVAAALQYISYYHPADYISHLASAYAREQSPAAKDAIAQILTNSKMSATGHRPMCQDTGIVNVFLKVGMDVRFEGFSSGLEDAINEQILPRPRCGQHEWLQSSSSSSSKQTPRSVEVFHNVSNGLVEEAAEALELGRSEGDGDASGWGAWALDLGPSGRAAVA